MRNFEKQLDNYMRIKRQEMKTRYNRVLPTGELIFNRFDKAKYLNCGDGSSIYDTSIIMGDVTIGENVWIGPYTILEGITDDLTIGSFVSISAGVMIYTHDSTRHYLSGGKAPFESGAVKIGDCTAIGTMCIISAGVSIGKHCVVGANSLVNINVPDYSIVGGTPAKIIGEVKITDDDVKLCYFSESGGK